MKRCPSCNRTYPDSNQVFCVDDGTPLKDADFEAAPYTPPGTYVAQPPASERRVWPWIVGIAGAFILGVVGLMIAAAIFVPRMTRQTPIVTVDDTNEETQNVDTPPPTDQAQVLAQLTDLENEWTVANLNADKPKLGRILADDYVGPAERGRGLQGKKEYIDTIERDDRIEKWEFKDLKVQLAGDRATLTGIINYTVSGQNVEFDFLDRFVWRNGRWQATGTEVNERNRH